MANPSTVRVGIVLPHSYYGEGEWQNAERAIAYADEAVRKGAQLVLYPEGYPGPMTGPLDNPKFPFDPVEELNKELSEPSPYSLNYEYWRDGGLDSWIEEYDRMYEGDYKRILKKYGGPFRFKER